VNREHRPEPKGRWTLVIREAGSYKPWLCSSTKYTTPLFFITLKTWPHRRWTQQWFLVKKSWTHC